MQVHNRLPSVRGRHAVYVLKDQGHGRLFEPGLRLEIEVHLREDLVHSLILRTPDQNSGILELLHLRGDGCGD